MKKKSKSPSHRRRVKTLTDHKAFVACCVVAGVIFGLVVVVTSQDKATHFGKIGESIETSAFDIRIESVERTAYLDVFTRKPVDGAEALIVRITVRNETRDIQSFLPVKDMFIKDNFGSILPLTPVYGLESPIMAGPIDPGKSVSGDVSFVLENKKASIRLFFDPLWDASPPVSIQL